MVDNDSKDFWKTIGRVGVGEERKKSIPMEIITEDGSVSEKPLVMKKWPDNFCDLLNPADKSINKCEERVITGISTKNEALLNDEISVEEVIRAMKAMQNNNSYGEDELPAEVLKSDVLVDSFTKLFNKCFTSGVIPDVWKKVFFSTNSEVIHNI